MVCGVFGEMVRQQTGTRCAEHLVVVEGDVSDVSGQVLRLGCLFLGGRGPVILIKISSKLMYKVWYDARLIKSLYLHENTFSTSNYTLYKLKYITPVALSPVKITNLRTQHAAAIR